MKRFLCAAVLLLGTAATGSAQDIPLSKILVEGEGWKVVAKDLPGVSFLYASSLDGSLGVVRGKKVGRITSDGEFAIDQPPPPPACLNYAELFSPAFLSYSLKGKNLTNHNKDALNL
jgi:hypothetical protein